MEEGVATKGETSKIKSVNEIYFEIVDALCSRFMALSPFEVLNTPMEDVFDLYVDVIIHDSKDKKKGINKNNNDIWVTSKNATWH